MATGPSADTSRPGAVAPGSTGGPEAGSPTSAELHRVVGRALEFQGFLLRRAWGIYYLTWSVAITVFFVAPGALAGPLSSPTDAEVALYDGVQGTAVVLVLWVTWWAVVQSVRAGRLRNAWEGRPFLRQQLRRIVVLGAAITALVVTVGFVSLFADLLVLDVSVGGVVLWVLLQVRPWFRPVPPEQTLAVASLSVSIGGSAAALLVTHDQLLFSITWIVAAAAWALAGVYALYHAPEEMTGASDA